MNRNDDPIADRLRRMAATDEHAVGHVRAEQIAQRALARASARPAHRALIAAIAGAAFTLVSLTGLGAIADGAVPGDALYTVDRVYERVGSAVRGDVDRSEERLIEALTLMQQGDRQAGVDHIARELASVVSLAPDADDRLAPVDEDPSSPEVTGDEAPAVEQVDDTPVVTAAVPVEPAEQPVAPAEVVPAEDGDEADPLVLAIEHALQVKRAATRAGDEDALAEADQALRSVLQLAIGSADAVPAASEGLEGDASEDVAAVATTTTTTTTAPGTVGSTSTTTSTTIAVTTTTVPDDDPEDQASGGDEPAGDGQGDSQEGAGGSNEPGDGSSQGPIFLPISP